MVVFLSIRKVMVLAVAGSCCRFCVCDRPTVRVKEVFSTDAILPDTDCSCGTLEVLDRFRSAASWVLGGENAQEAALLKDRKSTRLNSSHTVISYAVVCLKKKINGFMMLFALDVAVMGV